MHALVESECPDCSERDGMDLREISWRGFVEGMRIPGRCWIGLLRSSDPAGIQERNL